MVTLIVLLFQTFVTFLLLWNPKDDILFMYLLVNKYNKSKWDLMFGFFCELSNKRFFVLFLFSLRLSNKI